MAALAEEGQGFRGRSVSCARVTSEDGSY
jgi:hypothetical protein